MSAATLAELRDIVPLRPLTRSEALGLAERQALRLVGTLNPSGPVDESLVAELPRIDVQRFSPMSVSGISHWEHGRWLVLLNADEPHTRQRFSLAHELKHVLDYRFLRLMYGAEPEAERGAWIEQVCNYFAACLLMPRPWIKRAWAGGNQSVQSLAQQFDVSPAAMRVRLNQLRLVDPIQRCAPHSVDRSELARFAAAATGKGHPRR